MLQQACNNRGAKLDFCHFTQFCSQNLSLRKRMLQQAANGLIELVIGLQQARLSL